MREKPVYLRQIERFLKKSLLNQLKYLNKIDTKSLMSSIESRATNEELVSIHSNLKAIERQKDELSKKIKDKIKFNEDTLLHSSLSTNRRSYSSKMCGDTHFKPMIDELYLKRNKEAKRLSVKHLFKNVF